MSNPLWKTPPINYSSRDFESIRDDLIKSIRFFCPEWTDNNPSDFGIVMIELLSYLGDNLNFYMDRLTGESYLNTAVLRSSVVNMCKLIDYELKGKSSSTVDLKFYMETSLPLGESISYPAGSVVVSTTCTADDDTSPQTIKFTTTDELIIPSGGNEAIVPAIQGVYQNVTLGVSDGTENQSFTISDGVPDTLVVFVDEGSGPAEWEKKSQFDNLAESNCAESYTQVINSDGTVTITFGDNVHGKIPSTGSTISYTILIGGGSIGNCGANTINVMETEILSQPSGQVRTVLVTNPSPSVGGEDAEDIETARQEAPRSLRSLYRAVTPEDFENLTIIYPGVSAAKALAGEWKYANQTACCKVSVFVVPAGGGTPTEALKEGLTAYFAERQMACTSVEFFTPDYQPVSVKGTVYYNPRYGLSSAQDQVAQLITNFFKDDSPYVAFGRNMNLSDIYRAIDELPCVDSVTLTDFTRQPYPILKKWSGDAAFDSSAWGIGPNSVEETWTVSFAQQTRDSVLTTYFNVTGSVSGYQGAGTLDQVFVTNNGNLRLQITSGSEQMKTGDFAQFKTSPKLGDVILSESEFATEGVSSFAFVSSTTPRVGQSRICG